jgi:hypothetical protein
VAHVFFVFEGPLLMAFLYTSDQEWKHSCYRECLAPVLDVISQPSLLEYSVVLDLDKKIRDFSIPDPLRSRSGVLQSRSLIMQKASLSTALEAGASFDLSRMPS